MSVRKLLLASAAATFLGSAAQAAVFNFAGSVGQSTTFSITSGGLTASFASPGKAFAVQTTAGLFSFPVGLVDQNFFPGDTLTISFSQPVVGALSIPFGITDLGATTDFLSVSVNGGAAMNFAATPTSLPLAEPEGRVSLVSATGISTLTLTAFDTAADVLGFGIGNVSVPEPISLALLGAGLFGFAASRRRAA